MENGLSALNRTVMDADGYKCLDKVCAKWTELAL